MLLWRNLSIGKSARFYASAAGKITLLLLSVIVILLSLHNLQAITLSCSITGSGACNGTIVALVENESGGYDNAHAQILDDNITLYMPFDIDYSTNAGAVRDFSKYANNGTKAGNTAWNFTGKYGGAYSFDGSGDWILLQSSNSLNLSSGEFTVCSWFATTGTEEDIVGSSSTVTGDFLLMSYLTKLRGHVWTSAGSNTIDSDAVVNTGSWVHGCQVVNSTSITLYVNGTLDKSQLLSGTKAGDSTPVLTVGSRSANSASFNFIGMIDDVLIWNKSLSAGEISQLYTYQYVYRNAICCTTSSGTLSNSCSQSIPLKLSNYTNAHVQTGVYAGSTNYSSFACLSAAPGKIQCTYSDSACTGTYTCLGSIASSESGDVNLTNAHIASCNVYGKKICCKLNSPPEIQNIILNSTHGTNLTTENLTVYFNESDADGDFYTNITDWRINGTSIAVLNMHFDTNVSSTTNRIIRDYSTHNNNGTLGAGSASAVPTWTQNGKVGGGYVFDGVNDYIEVSNHVSLNPRQLTVSVWAKSNNATWDNYGCLVSKRSAYVLHPDMNSKSVRMVIINASGTQFSAYGPTPSDITVWHLYTATFNGTELVTYIDGVAGSPTTVVGGVSTVDTGRVAIGWDDDIGGRFCNQTLDEVYIFNRSLSAEQVKILYSAGVNNLSMQRIHNNETEKGENWTVALTGNDYQDGETYLSNGVVIRNTPPNVTLTAPADGNATTNRTPMFNWTGFDPDGDSLTYEINLTTFYDAGSVSLCSDVRTDTTANNYYIPSGDLLCLKDNGVYYRWSVRANDGGGYGPWSTTRVINITALTTISLTVNKMDFGSLAIMESNDSSDDAPLPFVIQNDGNSLLNINLTASNMWQSFANPSIYYKYKVDNVTGETPSFNWTGSVTGFTNTPGATEAQAFNRLNYTNIKDSGEIDIYVQVPPNEPPAVRNSTAIFYSYLAET